MEDIASRWTEFDASQKGTVKACAWALVHEVCLRYGLPPRILSDNGTQFISAFMQKITFCLRIERFTQVYHPVANPVERRNRDLKAELALLVNNKHSNWPKLLPAIRFAMNSAECQSTGLSKSSYEHHWM